MKSEAYTAFRKLGIMKEIHEAPPERKKEIMCEHFLSFAELKEWCDLFEKHDVKGLQGTAAAKGRRLR